MNEAQVVAPLRYTREGIAAGLRDGIPLGLSVVPWGVAFGVAAQSVVSTPQALVMSAYVYSGTAQFVALQMWQPPIAIFSLLLAVFAVNSRYLLQGLTLAPWLASQPAARRWSILFFLSDSGWATSLRRFENGYQDVGHLMGTGIAIFIAWSGSSWLGLMIPLQQVDPATWGLDFAVTAAIVALAGARWAGRASILPWTVAAVTALISERLLPGSWFMIIGGITGAVAGALLDGRRNNA